MTKVLGILNFESSEAKVEGLADYRPISAVSFLGRYRILDFMISNFTNSKIDNIQVHIKSRPRSVIEHIHKTNYNINSKRGRIHLLHGEQPVHNEIYNNDIASFMANMQFIEDSNASYVMVAPSHFVYIQDFNEMLNYHIESGNDITVLYQNVANAKDSFMMCDTLEFEDKKRITSFAKNLGKYKNRDVSLECYCMTKALFIELVEKAHATSSLFWLRDVIADSTKDLKVGGYQHKGYAACINTLKAYYEASMDLKDDALLRTLVSKNWPIHTMTNDSCPTLYKPGASVTGSIVGNGCEIEGTIINSVIGRGVVVKKG
ncbi:MAG: glucose-1-phosphate adenylyltransferase subunit GlgD, partial [Parabacteroides sp.]|nr:glucose-1-phosphate adenylyltransferase subunit GlgD [Parabacteroides sp.]